MRANHGVSFVSWKLSTCTMYMFCSLCVIAVFNVMVYLTRSNGTPIHLGVISCCGVSCGTISKSNSKDHPRGQLWKKHNLTQITSLTIVYSTVYLGTDQRKHQSSASLAFVRGIHRWPVNSPQQSAMFNCACVYEFRKVRIRGTRHFHFVGVLLFHSNVQTRLGELLLGRALLIGTLWYVLTTKTYR